MSNSKRRALSLVLVIAIIVSMFTMATTSVSALKYGNFPLGDADLDGQVGIRDATLVQMYITRQATMDEQQLRLADVNEYPDIQISDATFIQMIVAKMVADYPKNSEGLVIGKDTITYEEPTTAPETTEPTTELTTAPETTEPTTEPTTAPETTEPTTEPTTAPVTEPTTEPTTAPETTEPTTAPETTEPTTEPTTAPETTEPTTAPVDYDYYVAGDEALTGYSWSPDATENGMTKNADGTYSITYKAVPAGTYSFKVTDGTWENSWGVNGQNYGFTLNKASDVTITFNPTTTEITVKADGLGTFTLDYITAVGNGSGNWLNGENWVVDSEANKMTEGQKGVWSITYTNVPAGDDYQVKFACNGNWAYNWNADGHFDGQINTPQVVEKDGSTVTLVIDVNGFDFATKEGTVEIKFIVEEPETLPQTTAPTTEPTTAPVTDPTTEPTTAPVTDPTTEPTTAPVTDPTTEPTTAPVTDPTTEPTTAPVTDPTTEPTTAPVTDPTTEPTTAPSNTKTIKVGVINYVYDETSDKLDSYQVHYWGGAKSGDATCTALNTTEKMSVGSEYWSGAEQTFYMFTAEIPADATGYKFHIGDRWFGDDGDTTKSNAVYVFNYSGDKALYTTVTPVVPTEPTTKPTEATTEPTTAPVDYDYYVAGDEALTGYSWSPDAAENGMTKNADGTYSITYKAVPAGTYSFKVTDGTWENSWGVNGQNYGFTLNKESDVTITFNPTTTEITVKADGLGTFTLDYITAVGNGSGSWLNGENWVVDSETNKMTETEKGVWTITYTDVPAGDDYQVKFACNGNWAYNWNADGHFDGQINTPQVVEKDGSTVTLVIDVNGFDFATKEGTVEIKFIVEEPETLPQTTAPETTEPTTAPVTDPTTEPTTAPVTDPTTEPTTAPVTDPTTEPTTAPVTDPTTEPTTAPVTDPTTEPTTAPVTDPTTEPTTAPSNTKTIKVGVINYVYDETSDKLDSYQVHYWGGAKSGDATCTALNTTEKKSVGSSYWSNEAQTFQMFTVEIPADATGYKFHIGDRWFGDDGDTAKSNAVYVFNYSGDKALYTTVTPVNPTEPTTKPTEPTTEPTTAPSNTKKITVGVINYVYDETSSKVSTYQVHYWGGAETGDATCTPLNTTEKKSVGSSYWSNAAQTFQMFTVEIPKDSTGFKFHIGDRWFGADGDATKQDTVYIFNYSGDKALYE